MGWYALAAALASAGAGIYASNEASKAAQGGNKDAVQAQRDALATALRLAEPTRGLQYQAMGDLSSLYGYDMAPYTPLSQLISTAGGGGSYGGPAQQELYAKEIKRLLQSGMTPEQIMGVGNLTGDMNNQRARRLERFIKQQYVNKNDLAALAQQYGVTLTGKKKKDKKAVTGAIMNAFYQDSLGTPPSGTDWYPGMPSMPPSNTAPSNTTPVPGMNTMSGKLSPMDEVDRLGGASSPTGGTAQRYAYVDSMVPTSGTVAGGSVPSVPGGENVAGNFSRFFVSPDYQFRLQEGNKALDAYGSTRGQSLSGNRIRAGVDYSSNLAAGEYGNYYNRLMALVTGTQPVTTNSSNQVVMTGGNLSQLAQDSGLARASGIMGGANTAMNGINNALQAYYLRRA